MYKLKNVNTGAEITIEEYFKNLTISAIDNAGLEELDTETAIKYYTEQFNDEDTDFILICDNGEQAEVPPDEWWDEREKYINAVVAAVSAKCSKNYVTVFVDYGTRKVSTQTIFYDSISNQYKVTVELPNGYSVGKDFSNADNIFDSTGYLAEMRLDKNDRIYIIGTDYPEQRIYIKEISKESLN